MKTSRPRRSVRRVTAALGVTALFVAGAASPAAADTSQATAQAAEVDLIGLEVLDTGTASASNDGTQPTQDVGSGTTSTPGGIELLTDQDLLVAGVLPQRAVARNDGTSAACAGAVGPGGSIQIGDSLDCTADPGSTPGGVRLLGGDIIGGVGELGLISADAIYAECTADSDGTATGSATLVNAVLGGTLLGGILTGGTPIAANPGPNTVVNILGIEITLNKQTSTGPGQIEVTALEADLDLLGLGLGLVTIGKVTCGPNTVTAPIPVVPADGLPLAAGIVAMVLAGSAWVVYRRHRTVDA